MNKAEIVLVMKIKAHRNSSKVLKPREQPFDLPTAFVAAQDSTVLCRRFLPVRLMRRNHLDALLLKFCVERVTIIGFVANQSLRLFMGKNLSESFSDKGDFMRASRRRVNGERKTIAVCHRHELRTFAPLGLSHSESPFLATTNVPSIKHSDKSRSPRSLRSCARASSPLRNVPSLTDPLLKSAMARLVRREAVGHVLPACAASQYPENAIHDLAGVSPRSAAPIVAALQLRY